MNQTVHEPMELSAHIRVLDEWQDTIPEDLYIPPAAFEILLEHFEGPLDFLIYLIQKNGFDLLQLDIAPIAAQYLSYMDAMKSLNIELTADYMVMAALLADLKSRLLLPKPKHLAAPENDPKQELIDRLENYLRIKQAAERLGQMTILERDTFETNVTLGHVSFSNDGYEASLLRDAILCVFNRPEPVVHQVLQEPVLLEERLAYIESKLQNGAVLEFEALLKPSQGRMGMVVTFMAILELTRQQKVNIIATGIEAPLAIQGAHA
ncbi:MULTISPECIES: ScpA family protein [Acinetobacter]|jgi:segregation and condensation protein A|uniref:Segregation and condensation protein A n=2 Tax=Acinetobacter TaxID=469 RepID=A0A4Q7APM0_9GAMM|nr:MULTISPECIES: ScpA family protein [Acinetobacter]MCW8039913.1 segregation/condensation protein A [Acinetobacter entericus]RZG65081.1 segregation/condensation protein A [Acinetobacter bouvetii]TCB71137.1 segregation/condensation protein A [Acinetobacter sp. ANC 4177]